MSAIGPGDWVECVNTIPEHGCFWGVDDRLARGALYQVLDAFMDRDSDSVLSLVGHRRSAAAVAQNGHHGYLASRFRPIYHPKSELLESLLRKSDEPVKETA